MALGRSGFNGNAVSKEGYKMTSNRDARERARQFDSGSRNRSREDLHLAISEEVPSQAQVKGSGNESVGFVVEHYIVVQSLDVVISLESQKVAQTASGTTGIVHNGETNLARWEAPQEIATCC